LFKAAEFVDMAHDGFDKLQNAPGFVNVKLRYSFKQESMSQRGLWYAQAGALSYFFLQKKGSEVRQKFVDYVRGFYTGRASTPGWSVLGYESAEDLDKDFASFLKTVGR
jgi:hypothetical protein